MQFRGQRKKRGIFRIQKNFVSVHRGYLLNYYSIKPNSRPPNLQIVLQEDHLESAFFGLAEQLPAPIVNDTLLIPSQKGNGLMKSVFLEEGLYLRYTHLRYYEGLELIRLARQPDGEVIFALSFWLTPNLLKLAKPFHLRSTRPGYQNNIFLTSNSSRLSATIPEGMLSHTIELLFSREWLHTHLAGMEEKISLVSEVLEGKDREAVIAETTQPGDDQLLGEIEFQLNRPLYNFLGLRARALSLLANILDRLPDGDQAASPGRDNYYLGAMRQVEQRLVQSLQDMLPSQKQLAREFALSESTLKRHFKAIYGKTMYEYYLEKKMDLAKTLLQEKRISVSETAYRLGYEKVSAFIIIFKKYHKVLPGSLK